MAEIIDVVEHEVLTYEAFGGAVRELAQAIHDSGYEPDWLVAIARGGLMIGGALAYALGHKNIVTVNVEFYTGIDERLDVPVELPPVLNLDDIANRRVLVVDDVADTGETLRLVLEKCRPPSRTCAPRCCTRSRGRSCAATTSGGAPIAGSTSRGRREPVIGRDGLAH